VENGCEHFRVVFFITEPEYFDHRGSVGQRLQAGNEDVYHRRAPLRRLHDSGAAYINIPDLITGTHLLRWLWLQSGAKMLRKIQPSDRVHQRYRETDEHERQTELRCRQRT